MTHQSNIAPQAALHREAAEMRLLYVEAFVRRHVLALHDLAGAVAGEEGEALVESLVERLDAPFPDFEEVVQILLALRDLLAEAKFTLLEELSDRGVGPRDLDGQVRYYGARLSDLAGAPIS